MVKKPKSDKIETWITKKGDLCIGNECFTISQDGIDVKIEIHKEKCPLSVIQGYSNLLQKTVARGGGTLYKAVKVEIEEESEVKD